jgi:hypothetical protein
VLVSGGFLLRNILRSAMDWRRAGRQTRAIGKMLEDTLGASRSPVRFLDRLGGRRRMSDRTESSQPIELSLRPRVGFGGPGTVLTIDPGGAIPLDLVLAAEGMIRFRQDLEAGEPDFDSKIELRGSAADLAAILTKDVAAAVSRAVERDEFQLKSGRVRVGLRRL